MSTRARISAPAGVAVVLTILVLLLVGGATVPSSTPDARRTAESVPSTIDEIADQDRLKVVPSSARVRRELRVLSNGCRYNHRGIPRCGALLGAAYGSNTDPSDWEREMGRGLGVHRTYYDADEVGEAVHTARLDLRHERIPWISFKLPHGWAEMADRIPLRCFQYDPSVKSSLTFLRKTPWARQRVEAWYAAEVEVEK